MYKSNKLVKVVSVIMIILGVISLASTAFGYMMMGQMAGTEVMTEELMEAYKVAYSPLNITIGVVCELASVAAAILALAGKAFKVAVGAMLLYVAITIVSTFVSAAAVGAGISVVSLLISLILPVLFLWGMYQSKE